MPSIAKSLSIMLVIGATTNVFAAPSRRQVNGSVSGGTNSSASSNSTASTSATNAPAANSSTTASTSATNSEAAAGAAIRLDVGSFVDDVLASASTTGSGSVAAVSTGNQVGGVINTASASNSEAGIRLKLVDDVLASASTTGSGSVAAAGGVTNTASDSNSRGAGVRITLEGPGDSSSTAASDSNPFALALGVNGKGITTGRTNALGGVGEFSGGSTCRNNCNTPVRVSGGGRGSGSDSLSSSDRIGIESISTVGTNAGAMIGLNL